MLVASQAWKHKDDMVNAYIPYVSGDFIFQVDSDEIWSKEALKKLRKLLFDNPDITCLEFRPLQFWHNFETILVGGHWEAPFTRIFKFEKGAKWRSHEPPVLLAPNGRPYNDIKRINATNQFDISFYHYNYLTAEQARWKSEFFKNYYETAKVPTCDESTRIGMTKDWYEKVWLPWSNDAEAIESKYGTSPGGGPAWQAIGRTKSYNGPHPEVIKRHPLWLEPKYHHSSFLENDKNRVDKTGEKKSSSKVTISYKPPTLHFVYSGNPKKDYAICAPETITNKIFRYFEKRVDVRYYDWADTEITVEVKPNDIILGHPHPACNTATKRLFEKPCAGKFLLWPFHSYMPEINRYVMGIAKKADKLFIISGPYWSEHMKSTEYASWEKKIIRLDNALDLRSFPFEKRRFNRPGKRGLFVFGRSGSEKGTSSLFKFLCRNDYFVVIAGRYSESDLKIIQHRPNTCFLGKINWRDHKTREFITQNCDFYVNKSVSDASPTTLLECMALGLIPITTPQCGYYYPSMLLMSLHDETQNVLVLRNAQFMNDLILKYFQRENRRLIENQHSWEKFLFDICNGIKEHFILKKSEVQSKINNSILNAFSIKYYNDWINILNIDGCSLNKNRPEITIKKKYPKIVIDGVFFQIAGTGISGVWKSLLTIWQQEEINKYIVVLDRAGTAPKIDGVNYRTVPAYSYSET